MGSAWDQIVAYCNMLTAHATAGTVDAVRFWRSTNTVSAFRKIIKKNTLPRLGE